MNLQVTIISILLLTDTTKVMASDNFEFLILHNNDMHSKFEETREPKGGNPLGGFARSSYEIKQAREAAVNGTGPPVLYLNAGDTFQGSVWFVKHRWKICADFMNVLMPDAMTLGNHEFDDGIAGLVPFLQEVKFPVIACNMKLNKEGLLANLIQRSIILNLHGTQIGVIGYLTPETKLMSSVGTLEFLEEVEAVRTEAERLTKNGIRIIIANGHSGYHVDKKIAKQVEDVDIVIGGHTNPWTGVDPEVIKNSYPTEVTQDSGKVVPVVQAYAFTKYLGRLLVSFDNDGVLKYFKGLPILMDSRIPQDKKVLDLLDVYRPTIASLKAAVVGRTKVFLNGTCRVAPCNLGNLIMDSMINYQSRQYKGPYWTDAPIALMNSGAVTQSINTTLQKYSLTEADILGTLPFDSPLYIVQLKGESLLKTLETGARSKGETSRGEFLIHSGLKVVYDFKQRVGRRVLSAKARCSRCNVPTYDDVDKYHYYNIITTQFLMKGGDGHKIIRDKSKQVKALNITAAKALMMYFERCGLLTPELDKRTIINNLQFADGASKFSFGVGLLGIVLLSRVL